MLIEINSDNLFISQRIKEISSAYSIFYNTRNKKFEIHNSQQLGDSKCLTIPFPELDQRTIDLVYKTRIENINSIIEQIDKDNLENEKLNYLKLKNKKIEQLEFLKREVLKDDC